MTPHANTRGYHSRWLQRLSQLHAVAQKRRYLDKAPKHRHPQLKGLSISWLLKGWAPTKLFHTSLVWEVNHHELFVRCDVSDSTRAKAIPVLHRVARFPYPLPGASIFAPGRHLEQKSERNSSTCSDQKTHSSSSSTIITSNCRCTDCHIKTWTAFEHIFLWRP